MVAVALFGLPTTSRYGCCLLTNGIIINLYEFILIIILALQVVYQRSITDCTYLLISRIIKFTFNNKVSQLFCSLLLVAVYIALTSNTCRKIMNCSLIRYKQCFSYSHRISVYIVCMCVKMYMCLFIYMHTMLK